MNRDELYNDPEKTQVVALAGLQASIWTSLPGYITKVNWDEQTVEVQPTIMGSVTDEDGNVTYQNLPKLIHVPIVWPRGGGFALTFPLKVNDEVLVQFSARAIDSWWQSSGIGKPVEDRMHDLSDGFAHVGICSVPNALEGVSETDVELRNEEGTALISITEGGKLGFENASADLKGILTDLQSVLNTFMTTLAAFSGGGSPTTQAMLQAPAATAVSALAPILTKIGALLK